MATKDPKDEQNELEFTVEGKKYKLIDFTLGEVEELEEFTGESFTRIDYWNAGVLARIAWFVLRRENKSLTLEQVKARPMSILAEETPAEDEQPRPTRSRAKAQPTG